jgi:hypothetical protein
MGGDLNMEVPVTPARLRKRAMQYRAMVTKIIDQQVIDALNSLAAEYEELADHLERVQPGPTEN